MASKTIFKDVSRAPKDKTKTVAVAFGIIVVLLVVFIVWCAFMYSDSGIYERAVHDVSAMKIQLEEKDAQINALKEQIIQLEEQKKELEATLVPPEPIQTPSADDSSVQE